MSYPYGTRNGPAFGLSAPGLPRRQIAVSVGDTLGFPAKFIIARSSQQIRIPAWASYFRVGVTGNGGAGKNDGTAPTGGGGGGFAGTNIEKAVPGALITVRFDTSAVTVDCPGYVLSAGHGASSTSLTVVAPGGVGTGGAVNFNGGAGGLGSSGYSGGGGGAASRGGNGGAGGSASNGVFGTPGVGGNAYGYMSGGAPGGNGSAATIQPPASANVGVIGAPIIFLATESAFGGLPGDGGGGGVGLTGGSAGIALIEFW
jgi:hypothetical protein